VSIAKTERASFLKDRALEMVQRQGSSLQMPDYGIALECTRPSFQILYYDPANLDPATVSHSGYHYLDIYAAGRGTQEARREKVFSVRWIFEADLEVITFKRGEWEQVFSS
jgi:hypothetical protein